MERLVGTRVTRVEDPRLLSGRGRYVDDVVLPGMLHAAFCRSPFAHARVVRVETGGARALPGVVAVYTARDLAGIAAPFQLPSAPEGFHRPVHTALASDKVRHVGDPVAIVVATSRALAEDGCELIEVDYEELPAVACIDDALAASNEPVWSELGHNVMYRDRAVYGDPDSAFRRAAHVIHERFVQHRQSQVPMETRGAVADFDVGTGRLTLYAAAQGPHGLRLALAAVFGLPAHAVAVLNGDIGGSFGQKGYLRSEDVAIVAASKLLGRPVKWTEDRVESLTTAGHAREETLTVDAAVSEAGEILGLRVDIVLDQGAYPLSMLPSSIFAQTMRVLLPAAYRIRDYACDVTIVATNKATYSAYRGPWEAETWVRERLFDRIARELGLDPIEVRRVNLLRDDEMPSRMVTGPTLSGITLGRLLERAEQVAGWAELRQWQAQARAEGRRLGIGVSTFLEPAPGPPDYGAAVGWSPPPERATARLEADGTLSVFTSQAPHGQSHETTLAQVAADTLGVPMAAVRIVHGDTRSAPFSTVGTGGSRAATVATGSVMGAVRLVREQVQQVAASLLEANPDDVEVADGVARIRGTPSRALPLGQVAATAWMAPGLLGPGTTPGIEATYDFTAGEGGWTQSVHTCVVEVDVETGLVKILRYVVVEDCGDVINPGVVEGQIRGGIAQGIAGVLYEHAAYDDQGNFLASTFMDYLVPTACEIPPIEIHHLEREQKAGEVDARGVGEGGAIGAPAALTNAIEDALSPFGAKITQQYLPPSRILELIGRL